VSALSPGRPQTSLLGKVALVTGGAIGIGRAVAVGLAEVGADVAITYHTHSGDEVVKEIAGAGRRATAFQVDVRVPADVDAVVKAVRRELGTIDVLVANAGGLIARVPLTSMPIEHWHDVLETNLSSAFYVIRAALAHINDNGRIVLISSMAAHTGGSAGAGAYAAAKAGMIGLTRAFAKELAPRGIAVNAVAPGLILGTPFHEQFTPPAAQEAVIGRLPMGRAGRPGDVASVVTYLASGATDFLTGEVINLSGGQELT
jgi:3-oxoacyl-[acyl-carrier protein] reductase